MHFGKGNIGYMYSMNGHALEEVATVKDLGVIFFSDLKVSNTLKRSLLQSKPNAGIDQSNNKIQESDNISKSFQVAG